MKVSKVFDYDKDRYLSFIFIYRYAHLVRRQLTVITMIACVFLIQNKLTIYEFCIFDEEKSNEGNFYVVVQIDVIKIEN